jgi:hypothetical protein
MKIADADGAQLSGAIPICPEGRLTPECKTIANFPYTGGERSITPKAYVPASNRRSLAGGPSA